MFVEHSREDHWKLDNQEKLFYEKEKRQDEENEIREKEIKVDSSGRKVKKLRNEKKNILKRTQAKDLG